VIDQSNISWRRINDELIPFMGDQEVSWAAQPGGQQQFLSSPIFETLFAGNRGGGKSISLLMDYAQHVGVGFGADWRGVIFRQTYPQLQDIVSLSKKWFPKVWPAAQFNEAQMKWKFPGKEELLFRHILTGDDYWSYHGWSIPWLGFEELTTWPDDKCYKSLFSICRSVHPNMPRKIRATTNPYGPGHGWVKNRFRLPIGPGRLAGQVIRETDLMGRSLPERVAVRSELRENRVMLTADPFYLDRLRGSASNESQFAAWVDGSWDIVAGGMFDDVWKPEIHVIPNIYADQIPDGWRIDRSYDHGQSKPFSVGWWAESNGEPIEIIIRGKKVSIGSVPGDLVRIAEWYGCTNTPNEGLRMTTREIAFGIMERETRWRLAGRVRMGVADSSIFDDYSPGHCVAGDMEKCGVHWFPADKGSGSRAQGWQQIRLYMKSTWPVPGGKREHPGIYICEGCDQFTRTVPALPRDEKKIDDVDTTSEDHIGDEVRYRLRMKNMLVRSGRWK
jgi:hypothetical protein